VLFCKSAKNSGSEITDRLCFGIRDGLYFATIYNETLNFEIDVEEGWNFLAYSLTQDTTSNLYSRVRVVAYSRTKVAAAYRTFSYTYYDDVGLDLYIGAKFDNDGIVPKKGFVGYLLEFRLFSNAALTMADLDNHLDWDCTLTTKKLCSFCPSWVGLANVCLEDFTNALRTSATNAFLKAQFSFDSSSISSTGRSYYRSTLNSASYDLYFSNAPYMPRLTDQEPFRTESNGLYFNGKGFMTMNT
jgi:hypothetical protein